MKAFVDQAGCIGCRLCASVCPRVFSMDSENKATALNEEIPQNAVDEAKEAERACPASVITLEF